MKYKEIRYNTYGKNGRVTQHKYLFFAILTALFQFRILFRDSVRVDRDTGKDLRQIKQFYRFPVHNWEKLIGFIIKNLISVLAISYILTTISINIIYTTSSELTESAIFVIINHNLMIILCFIIYILFKPLNILHKQFIFCLLILNLLTFAKIDTSFFQLFLFLILIFFDFYTMISLIITSTPLKNNTNKNKK